MANKSVSILLTLKDKFSGELKKATKSIKSQKAALAKGTTIVKKWGNTANKAFKTAAKAAALATGAIAGIALKTGLTEAMNLEGYKAQLETATKDTKKAADIMQYSIKMANKTPFEGGELVEGAAKFEAMGMSAKKWLTLTGDMAGATNKSFDQATEALIDAQTGELERLKEFGITKAMIAQKGEELFSDVQIVNNKGQIVNQQKFNEALQALMVDKFSGGMEKQANTVRGIMSTITGITKNALANILGMSNDGSIQAGSALDYIKEKAKGLADRLQEMQANGDMTKLVQGVGAAAKVLGGIFSALGTAISFVVRHFKVFGPILAGVVAGFVAFNVINGVIKMMQTMSVVTQAAAAAQGMLNLVIAANPIGALAAVIGIVIGAIILLIANFDKVKAVGAKVFGFIKAIVMANIQTFIRLGNIIKSAVGGALNWIKSKALAIGSAFKSVGSTIKNAFSNALNAVKSKVSSVFGWIKNKINGIKNAFHSIGSAIGGALGIGGHATGSSYFAGGLTRINEGGRGEIVNLPNGTQIIPHDVSERMAADSGGSVVVNITVQGNVIGNRQYMEETGRYITKRILLAQGAI